MFMDVKIEPDKQPWLQNLKIGKYIILQYFAEYLKNMLTLDLHQLEDQNYYELEKLEKN